MFFIFNKFKKNKELKKEVQKKEQEVKSASGSGIDYFENNKRTDNKLQGYHALDLYRDYLDDDYDEYEAQEQVCYDTAEYINEQMGGVLDSDKIDELAEYLGEVAEEIDMWNKA
jgi:hypothetical protein